MQAPKARRRSAGPSGTVCKLPVRSVTSALSWIGGPRYMAKRHIPPTLPGSLVTPLTGINITGVSETKPGAPRWTIADYREGDEARIVALFERVFAKPMGATKSLEHWRWKFAQNPVDPKVIELVWDGERLVGQYTISPRKLRCSGAQRLGALSLDTMTDPDYGRQGIFTASAEACYARLVEHDFACVYGFPNANSIHGFEKRLGAVGFDFETLRPELDGFSNRAGEIGGLVAPAPETQDVVSKERSG